MNKGEFVEMDAASTIYHSPKKDYTKNLLAAIPKGIPKEMLAEQQQ